ncbi:MAG: ABC transporter permease [Sphingobacterium sp.]
MIKSYFKIAVRNLRKNKGFTAINVMGLAIGMAAAMLIMLWVNHQVKVDRSYSKIDNLYVVGNKGILDGVTKVWFSTPKPFAESLKNDFQEVENVTRLEYGKNFLMKANDKSIKSGFGVFVDSAFFEMFDLPIVRGDRTNILNSPSEIVITESLAKKLFGSVDVLGKMIKLDSTDVLSVSAIIKDMPSHSRFRNNEYYLPWQYLEKLGLSDDNWANNSTTTFLELKPETMLPFFESKIKGIYQRHRETSSEALLQPLAESWLYNKFENGKPVGGRIEMVRIFITVACSILLIACINFMNLSTAQNQKRAKEVGVRKVVGARRRSLIVQFLIEAILLTILSGILAIILVVLCLPTFNQIIGNNLLLDVSNYKFWLTCIGFTLLTGLLAGSYPAFLLSSFQPVKILTGRITKINNGINARKMLVVFQFSIAIVLVLVSIILSKQIQHGLARESGFDTEKLIYINDDGNIKNSYTAIKQELLTQGIATSVSRTRSPLIENWSSGTADWEGKALDNTIQFNRMSTDDKFVRTAGLTLIEGRDFDLEKYPTDSSAMILNKSAAEVMDFKNPIGQIVKDEGRDWHIIGIVNDYVQESPFGSTSPMIIQGAHGWLATTNIKLNPKLSTQEALDESETIFKKFNPEYPFEYHFVDEAYAQKFEETKALGTLANLFTGLTIFISCLGLFGLTAFMADNRTKEIGIRKVLGASIFSVVQLLSKEFVILIIIACFIAFPVAYWAMSDFLAQFVYRTTVNWSVFVIAGLGSLLLAILIISYQSIKAAIANPVESLRDE